MLFNSWGYIFFLFIGFSLHWLLPHQFRIILLSAFSFIFYAMWRWDFCLLMIFSACVDFIAARQINAGDQIKIKKFWLWLSISINVGLLIFFKYSYFLYDNIQMIGSLANFKLPDLGFYIILPLGISFYTFQTISYTIDVYRAEIKPTNNFLAFLTYVTFWPQLVAGPILRANQVIPQLLKRRKFDTSDLGIGIERVLIGLFKKVVLADNIAFWVDKSFALDPVPFTAFDVWVSAILFGFQIYFDFSGYSDIAIGSARILGIKFPENFNWPYFSTSPADFWRRWHISLSSWLRDYIYIPTITFLGSKNPSYGAIDQKNRLRNISLMWVFFICGLWHGAGWTFIVWGLMHGLLIFLYRRIKSLQLINKEKPLISWCVTFCFVMLAWIPFRSSSLAQTYILFSKILNPLQYTISNREVNGYCYIITLAVFSGMAISYYLNSIDNQTIVFQKLFPYTKILKVACMVFAVLVYLRPIRQFIYFQF